MLRYNLDYLFIGVIIGAVLMTVLLLVLYLFGLIAVKSDFSDKWLTKANIIIVKGNKE